MPQVSLTSSQQAQIDSANAAVATAQADYNAKKSQSDQIYKRMQNAYNDFVGKSCNYKYQASLEAQISGYGTLNAESCGGNFNCSREKCKFYVQVFNIEYNAWVNSKVGTDSALKTLENAKTRLNQVLDEIAKDPTIAANTSIINNEIDAQKQKDMIKWIFLGLAAVIIVGAGIWIGTRTLRATA